MTARAVLRALGYVAGKLIEALWPAQAVRAAMDRDFSRAVTAAPAEHDAAEALAEREAEQEVSEPDLLKCGRPTCLCVDDDRYAVQPLAEWELELLGAATTPRAQCKWCGDVDSADHRCRRTITYETYEPVVPNEYEPGLTDDELVAVRGLIQERYQDSSPAVGRTVGDGPAAVSDPPGAPAAGHPELTELTELTVKVLEHHEYVYGDGSRAHCYAPATDSLCGWFDDLHSWNAHIAQRIADRIEKATPPAPFTFGDLSEAARIVRYHATMSGAAPIDSARRQKLVALADRLADAADADPNP